MNPEGNLIGGKEFPKVSVIMPVYNAEEFVGEAIESILNQTFKDFELIVIDDASTDGSLNIVEAYAKKDKRMVVLKNEKNVGVSATKNKGLKVARGKYVAIMDADDISFPDRLKIEYEYLEVRPDIYLVGSSFEYISEEGEVINVHKVSFDATLTNQLLKIGYVIRHSSIIFRNTKEFLFEESLRVAEDKFFYKQLSMSNKKMEVLFDVLVKYRIQKYALSTKYLHLLRSLLFESYNFSTNETDQDIINKINVEIKNAANRINHNFYLRELMAAYGEKVPNRKYIIRLIRRSKRYVMGLTYYLATFFPKKLVTKVYKISKTILALLHL